MNKSLIELDCKLSELEVTHNKAEVMCSDLLNDYFGYDNPEAQFLKLNYEESDTKSRILNDYLYEIKTQLKDFKEWLNKEFEESKSNKTA